MMWWYGPAAGGWGMVLMAATTILLWALAAAGLAALLRYLARGRQATGPPDAEELLALRFARGELDEQQYRARLDVLREVDAGHAT